MNNRLLTWNHIYPVNDKGVHQLTGFGCRCNPRIDYESKLIIHNAFDFRDVIEEANRIIRDNAKKS